MVFGIFKINLSRDWRVFMWESLEILDVFNILTLKKIFWKTKAFFKKQGYRFLLKVLRLKTQHFHTKCMDKSEKNEVSSVTTLFFRTFCFSLRTSYKELIWCTNYPNFHIHTFRKRWSFTVSMVKYPITIKHSDLNSQEPVSLNSLINENLTKVTKA